MVVVCFRCLLHEFLTPPKFETQDSRFLPAFNVSRCRTSTFERPRLVLSATLTAQWLLDLCGQALVFLKSEGDCRYIAYDYEFW